MRALRLYTLILLSAALTPGCRCKDGDDSNSGATAEPDVDTSVASGVQTSPSAGGATAASVTPPLTPVTTSVTTTTVAPGFALARLTPEQLSNDLVQSVNFGTELRLDAAHSWNGQPIDYMLLIYGVPLGGIDFGAAARRDPTTKAQTLLVSRTLAWFYANSAIWKDVNLDPAARVLFTKADIVHDRPDATDPMSVERWSSQVEEWFWRFYSRPPTTTEVAAVRVAFLAGMKANVGEAWESPYHGWLTVLYALLATQEFFHA